MVLYSLQTTSVSVVSSEFFLLLCEFHRTSTAVSISQGIKPRLRESPGQSANKQLSGAGCPSGTRVCLDGEGVHCGRLDYSSPMFTIPKENYVPQLCQQEVIWLALANEMWAKVMYVTLEQKPEDPARCSPGLFSFCHEIWQLSTEKEYSISWGAGIKMACNRNVVDPSWI